MEKVSNTERKKILKEIDKLIYTYGLNKVIRYNKKRKEKHQTQSVAEHVTNMLFCAYYFRDLENVKKLDFDKIVRIFMMHDMGEIETGDIITTDKKQSDILNEEKGIQKVKKQSPDFVAKEVVKIFEDFEWMKTEEARFAKAVDKFEGILFWSTDSGINMIKTLHGPKTRKTYFKNLEDILRTLGYKVILKYMLVLKDDMIKRGVLN
jgi:putative hydrolase of HD superfamily